MNILTVLTGGTIGSKAQNNFINITGSSYHIIEKYKSLYNCTDIFFDVFEPLNTLSENITEREWEFLVNFLLEKDFSKYDGVIVTHGSDTLAYTSVLLSYIFEDISIPVTLVASDYPLGDERSNWIINFNGAVEVIRSAASGVFVSYKNKSDKNAVIYPARRLIPADAYNDDFSSFDGKTAGYINGGGFVPLHTEKFGKSFHFRERLELKNKVWLMFSYPGMDYSAFDIDSDPPKGIVHYLYHSSTGCVSDGKGSLPNFISECKKRGIHTYIASLKSENQTLYASTKILLDSGARPLYNMSAQQAYIWTLLKENE